MLDFDILHEVVGFCHVILQNTLTYTEISATKKQFLAYWTAALLLKHYMLKLLGEIVFQFVTWRLASLSSVGTSCRITGGRGLTFNQLEKRVYCSVNWFKNKTKLHNPPIPVNKETSEVGDSTIKRSVQGEAALYIATWMRGKNNSKIRNFVIYSVYSTIKSSFLICVITSFYILLRNRQVSQWNSLNDLQEDNQENTLLISCFLLIFTVVTCSSWREGKDFSSPFGQ